MTSIQCVVCCYALEPREIRVRLQSLALRLGLSIRGVIVCNRPQQARESDANWEVIGGTNRTHDFSAYAEGLAHLMTLNGDLSGVVFINDSLFTSHHPRANLGALQRQLHVLQKIQGPAIAGKVDRYRTFCHANPWSDLNIFVSSYCFGLNRAALPTLLELENFANQDLGDLETLLPIHSPEWGGGLTTTFREFIRGFLTYGHPDYHWPGINKYQLDARLLAIKARCIYMEHRLSGEVGRHGCILPTNLTRMDRIRMYVGEMGARMARSLGLQFK